MRIAYLSHFYPPNHNSGVEQNTHGIASAMRQADHSVAVLAVNRWSEGDTYWQGYTEDEWEGIPIRRFNVNWRKAPSPNHYLYDNPLLADQVHDFLVEFEPDVVHITSMYTLSARIIEAVKKLKLPIVFTISDFWIICPRHTLRRYDASICDAQVPVNTCQDCLMSETRTYRALSGLLPSSVVQSMYMWMLQHPQLGKHIPGSIGLGIDVADRRRVLAEYIPQIDHLIAPSEYVKRIVTETGLPVNIEVANYGNNLSWLANYRPRAADNEIHFGYMGQITPIKGIHLLIDAFQKCRFPDPVKLYIYGKLEADPAYTGTLKSLAADNPNIHLMGSFLRPDLPQVLSNIDVLVVPSIWPEVAGLVVQEAFAAKIPVLASKMGGLPEFVRPGAGGLLFDIDSGESLQNTLTHVVDSGSTLLDEMRASIPPVRTVEDERKYLEAVYQRLTAAQTAQ